MMSARNRSERRQATRRFQRAMRGGEAAMAPYMDKLETGEGIQAMLMVAGIAKFVAIGIESPAFLENTIQQAAEISGIPPEVWGAYAQVVQAMHEGAGASMEGASPCDGDKP